MAGAELRGRPAVRPGPRPELWAPLRLTAVLRNDCFFALLAAPGSRLAVFFASAVLGRSVLLGQAPAALRLPPRSLVTAVLDAELRYAWFENAQVLAEVRDSKEQVRLAWVTSYSLLSARGALRVARPPDSGAAPGPGAGGLYLAPLPQHLCFV